VYFFTYCWWALGSLGRQWKFAGRRRRRRVASGVDPGCSQRGGAEQATSQAVVAMIGPRLDGDSGVCMGVLYATAERASAACHCPALRQDSPFDLTCDDEVRCHPVVHPLRAFNRCQSVATCPWCTWELICTVFNVQNWLMPVSAKIVI